ncbi:MAG TPA: Fur family transcriptional regulator [Pseudobdellovibrionaceae bacterium]|nr:Fur family transcriptional regulator [Pseudobdellovibrionaceae bacterium]
MKHDKGCHTNLDLNTALRRLESALKAKRQRLTEPRRKILKAVMRSKAPFSAEELHRALKRELAVDLATVYRSLQLLQSLEIIHRVDLSKDHAMFEVAAIDHAHHHHHYVVCRNCDRREQLPSCDLEAVELALQKRGYQELQHRLEFTGLCGACRLELSKST